MDEAVGPPLLHDELVDANIVFPAGGDADDHVSELAI
jgi:hypothetical protein